MASHLEEQLPLPNEEEEEDEEVHAEHFHETLDHHEAPALDAEISYDFDDMHVKIPSGTGAEVEHAEWVFSGKLKVSTKDNTSSPK